MAGSFFAAQAGAFSLGAYYASKSPFIALKFDDGNGLAAGKAIGLLESKDGEDFTLSPGDRDILMRGLRRDPLSRAALRDLGVAAYLEKDDARARKYMVLTERVSRREPAAQIWLIGDNARRGNLASTIKHYDRALSTAPSARDLLYESLSKALAYPEIDKELAPLIHNGRSWVPGFVIYATGKVEKASHLGRLLEAAAPLDNMPQRDVILKQLLDRFVAQGDLAGAGQFATSLMAAKPEIFNDLSLNPATSDQRYSPLTWTLQKDGAIVTDIARDGSVEAMAPPGTSGLILSRTIAIGPGRYEMQLELAYPDGGEASKLEWSAICIKGTAGRAFWSQEIPPVARNSRYSMDFIVPSDCAGVRFVLIAKDTDRRGQSFFTIKNIAISRTS